MDKTRAVLVVIGAAVLVLLPAATASHTPDPTRVTVAGSLQSEAGCAGDWDPACAVTHLTYDASDDVWQGTFACPPAATSTRRRSTTRGRELRPARAVGRGEHPAEPPVGRHRQVLLRPQVALDHRQHEAR